MPHQPQETITRPANPTHLANFSNSTQKTWQKMTSCRLPRMPTIWFKLFQKSKTRLAWLTRKKRRRKSTATSTLTKIRWLVQVSSWIRISSSTIAKTPLTRRGSTHLMRMWNEMSCFRMFAQWIICSSPKTPLLPFQNKSSTITTNQRTTLNSTTHSLRVRPSSKITSKSLRVSPKCRLGGMSDWLDWIQWIIY